MQRRRVCGRRGLATGAGGVSGKTRVLGAVSEVFASHDGSDASTPGRGGGVSPRAVVQAGADDHLAVLRRRAATTYYVTTLRYLTYTHLR